MQRGEEDTYVSHFPAELFPGWQQLRYPRPHVRQREEGQLDKAGCLLRCLIMFNHPVQCTVLYCTVYSHCTLLSRRDIKALLGDRKQSALYLFLLNTRMSIRMQDLKPWREIRSGQQPMFIVQWNFGWPSFVLRLSEDAGRQRQKQRSFLLPWNKTDYGGFAMLLRPPHPCFGSHP